MARPRSDIAPRIVRAAEKRFLQEGVDGASLRAIADDAGTSIGMVYYYFPTKDDLFFAVVEETYSHVLAKLEHALHGKTDQDPADFEAKLVRLYTTIGSLTDAEMVTLRLVLREVLVSSSRFHRLIERFQRGHIPMIFSTLLEAIQAGKIDASRPFPIIVASAMSLGIIPQIMRRIAGGLLPIGPLQSPELLAREMVDVLLHGIGPRPPPSAAPPQPDSPASAAPPGQLPVKEKRGKRRASRG